MAGFIDSWGRGTLKIINSCKDAGLPEPEIIEKEAGVMVALHKYEATTDQVGGQVLILTKRQKEVLALIVENPLISRKQLAEKLGINESAVQKHTDALKKKDIIERDSATTGQWIIKAK